MSEIPNIAPGNARKPPKPPITFTRATPATKRKNQLWWTDERVAMLKAGVDEGLSFAQIGRRICCTRMAALGKARRMGFSQPGAASRPTRMAKAPAPPVLRLAGRGTVFVQAVAPPPRVIIPERDEPPGLRTVETIKRFECRWPIGTPGEEGFTLCGATAAHAYCDHHHAIAFKPFPVGAAKNANDLARSLRRYL